MKTQLSKVLFLFLFCSIFILPVYAQSNELNESGQEETNQLYIIVKDNGAKFIGEILSQDAHEVLLKTEDLGEIYIPRYVIKEIRPLLPDENKHGVTDELFATRYFITTNGLPIKKGENYIQWNLYGPDFQFGVADNFGVGVMTSWAAIPIIGTAKYSLDLGKNKSMALGLLAGTGSWALPEFGLVLPYVSFTLGNRRNNLTFSTGYGKLFYEDSQYTPYEDDFKIKRSEGRFLLSVAGMAKINEKFSLVFDTFISPWGPEYSYTEWVDNGSWDENTQQWISDWKSTTRTEKSPNLALLLPGIRWQLDADKAFQFGFTGFYFNNEFIPAPIPMVQWYRRL